MASEVLREDQCREHLICEAYQRDFMSDWGIDEIPNSGLFFSLLQVLEEFFPVFSKAKRASSDSKSRSEGCNYHYTGCTAISRAFHGRERVYGTHKL